MRRHHRRGPGQPHEGGPDRFRDPLVEFVRNDTADVVSLEDLRVLPHVGLASRSLSVAPPASASRPGLAAMHGHRAYRSPAPPTVARDTPVTGDPRSGLGLANMPLTLRRRF